VAAGEFQPPIHLTGDDELARLAESHNRIAADAQRRNAELAGAPDRYRRLRPEPGSGAARAQAERDARQIYGLIDCRPRLGNAKTSPSRRGSPAIRVPSAPRSAPGPRPWACSQVTCRRPATGERADQDLLELFASEVGVALRNAELFGRIESQNAQLRELDAPRTSSLRGVSHNLQTPLTSIRAYVEQLRASTTDAETDRRLAIVAEQSGRLTRLVRQLLTVTRLEAGVLRAEPEVIAIGPRVRRAWEALNATGPNFELSDESRGWLAVADPDQLDQVLWALLDNGREVRPGRRQKWRWQFAWRTRSAGSTSPSPTAGPACPRRIASDCSPRLHAGAGQPSGEGTGLGCTSSRQLLRAMDGELWLEPAEAGRGAAFTLSLPGEPPATRAERAAASGPSRRRASRRAPKGAVHAVQRGATGGPPSARSARPDRGAGSPQRAGCVGSCRLTWTTLSIWRSATTTPGPSGACAITGAPRIHDHAAAVGRHAPPMPHCAGAMTRRRSRSLERAAALPSGPAPWPR